MSLFDYDNDNLVNNILGLNAFSDDNFSTNACSNSEPHLNKPVKDEAESLTDLSLLPPFGLVRADFSSEYHNPDSFKEAITPTTQTNYQWFSKPQLQILQLQAHAHQPQKNDILNSCGLQHKRILGNDAIRLYSDIRSLFNCRLNKKGKTRNSTKREVIQSRFLRHFRKLVRLMRLGKIPRTGLCCMKTSDLDKQFYYQNMLQLIRQYPEITVMCSKCRTPKTDRSNLKLGRAEFNCHNDAYINYFFIDEIKEIWPLYVDFIFSNESNASLCEKFNFDCCQGRHSPNCHSKWDRLRDWMKYAFI